MSFFLKKIILGIFFGYWAIGTFAVIPGQVNIQSVAASKCTTASCDVTISWAMWYGENGTSITATTDAEGVQPTTNTLESKTPEQQLGEITLQKVPGGEHNFTVSLNNSEGSTKAAQKYTVEVLPGPPIPGPGFASKVFAPYVDVMLYPTFSLQKVFEATGQKYYTLAFLTAGSDGKPAWGGSVPLENYYYVNEINYIRKHGGDVIVSLGGANGTPVAATAENVALLVQMYENIVDDYKLTRVDFDVEGAWVADTDSIKRRNSAIAKIQQDSKYSKLNIAYCLPILPSGLTYDGINVLDDALAKGVKIDHVNAMTMDYGMHSSDMAKATVDAANNLFLQLKQLYSKHGILKTDAELWNMIGITPMIGQNDTQDEVVSLENAAAIEKFAAEKGVGFLAMWSANRDNGDKVDPHASPSHSGIVQDPFDFTKIFNKFIR
jgi:hypothetical protein